MTKKLEKDGGGRNPDTRALPGVTRGGVHPWEGPLLASAEEPDSPAFYRTERN